MLFTHGECSPFSGLLDNNRRAKVRFSAYMAPPTLNFFSLFAYCASQLQGKGGNSSTESVFPKGFTQRQGRGICTQAIPRSALPYQTERTAPYSRKNYFIKQGKLLYTVVRTTPYSRKNCPVRLENLVRRRPFLSCRALFARRMEVRGNPETKAATSCARAYLYIRSGFLFYKEVQIIRYFALHST